MKRRPAHSAFYEQQRVDDLLGTAVVALSIDKWGKTSDRLVIESAAAMMLLELADRYLRAAGRAMERVTQASGAMETAADDVDNWGHGGAEQYRIARGDRDVELHSYLASWAMVRRALVLLARRTGRLRMRSPSQVQKRHRGVLKAYSDLRDHFEHQDERMPGEAEEHILTRFQLYEGRGRSLVMDWWPLRDDGSMTIEGVDYDLSPDSLNRLQAIVDELKTEIREESLDIILARKSPYEPEVTPPWDVANAMHRPKGKRRRS